MWGGTTTRQAGGHREVNERTELTESELSEVTGEGNIPPSGFYNSPNVGNMPFFYMNNPVFSR
jgi:hypothetical protein